MRQSLSYPIFGFHIDGAGGDFIFVIRLRTVLLYLLILAILCCTIHFYVIRTSSVPVNADAVEESVTVPILMYHAVTKEPSKVGRFVISEEMLEQDLQYIQKAGYETVTVDDVIRYVKEDGKLPEKPIILTFDDGYYNNYCYAYPLLQKYRMKAVISPIGKYSDLYTENTDRNPAYAHITWDNIREMMQSGLVEFQNHSYDLHHNTGGRTGAKKKKGESQAAYGAMLESDLLTFQEKMRENTGYTPTTFTYPFGGISEASYEILDRMGFQATLSCEERLNEIVRKNPSCLKNMYRYLRSNTRSAKQILTNAMAEKEKEK